MRKKLARLLALIWIFCLGFACAEPAQPDDLTGSWSTVHSGIPLYCFMYDDFTFEATFAASLPMQDTSFSGVWALSGATVTFSSGDRTMTFTWDGDALVGELFGTPVVLTHDTGAADSQDATADTEPGATDATGATDNPGDGQSVDVYGGQDYGGQDSPDYTYGTPEAQDTAGMGPSQNAY